MLSDILKEQRKKLHLTQDDVANMLGVKRQTYSAYERGISSPDAETLALLADFFGVSTDYLLDRENPERFSYTPVAGDVVEIPVLGDVAAGYDYTAVEDRSGETVDIPAQYLRGRGQDDFFVLRIKGDSMYPVYMEGDKVLVLRQTTLNYSGQVGVLLYDDCATLKKVEYIKGEDWLRMVPLNPSYPPKKISGSDLTACRVLGIPKMLLRDIDE